MISKPNYSRKAQAPRAKLKTEPTSESSKIAQYSAECLSQLKRKLGRLKNLIFNNLALNQRAIAQSYFK